MDTPSSTPNQALRSTTDQRRTPRRTVHGVRCRVQTGSSWLWIPAGIIDFSVKGLRLRTPLLWAAGQTRRIRVVAGPVRLELDATCIWSREDGKWARTVGAAFEGVTPAQTGLLTELLASHGVDPALSEAA
jgi:hypothetical protein